MQLIYSSVSSVRAPRARETRCDVRILPATEHCCQRAEIRRNGANVHEGGRPPPNRLRVGHDFARFQWFSRGVPPFRAAGAATGAAWKFIERAWTRNGAFTDPRIEYRVEQGRVVWKFRNGISSRRFPQQYRKLLDLVTLPPPPPPLARTCRRSTYRSFDRASHIRRISSFVLPRGSVRSYLEPLYHDLNFPRFSTRAIFLLSSRKGKGDVA